MLHLVARARSGRLMFVCWSEARALWDRVVGSAGGLAALVLMPDHLHLLHPADVRPRLAHALSGYTRWLNHRHGRAGPLFDPLPEPEDIADEQKLRRSVRYVHLNPCRARLCDDPLAWPFSTHRDLAGLAPFPVLPANKDPTGFHAYVSADPTVRVDGTELPTLSVAVPDAAQVLHAVSAVTRTPLPELQRRGRARSLYLRAARTITRQTHRVIGEGASVTRWTVQILKPREDAHVRLVARVIGDPRFPPLWDQDLRGVRGWFRYRDRY